jgi:hypothetical protein
MRWNTKKITKLLSIHNTKIEATEPGGDYDSTTLLVEPVPPVKENQRVYVAGFRTRHLQPGTSRDDFDIDMIEVNDGLDSRGGLNSSNSIIAHLYAEICTRLRGAGFTVVPKMDDYF